MNKIVSILLVCIFCFLFSFKSAFAQNYDKQETIEDLIEEIASNSDEDIDFSSIYDDLKYYLDYPLNLNVATYDDLIRLHFLDDIQINDILNYTKKYGSFGTIYELQLLDNFSREDIQKLLPFVTVEVARNNDQKLSISKALKYGRNQVFIRTQSVIEPMLGYNIPDSVLIENPDKSYYPGNSFKYYFRYQFQYRDQLQWGITAEKDPGEEFFSGAQKNGFDYYSAHLQIDNKFKNFSNRIVLGDFQAQFGQGLTLWTGLSFGKSAYVLNIKKKPQGLKKYSSTDENLFLRGGGVMFHFDRLSFSAFASYHKIDANLNLDTLDENDLLEASSFQTTGYHRTASEIAGKHSIGQTVFGGNISYNHPLFRTGITFVDYNFSAPLIRDLQPYQLYQFQGNSTFNIGWNYEFEILKFHFFGETAMGQNNSIATVNGLSVPLEHRVSMVALYRNYSKNYFSYFSGAFSEGSSINNEKGIYFGLEIFPYKNFKFSTYIDSYVFPWLDYRINAPLTNGLEYFAQLDYSPKRELSMYVRFKHELKPQNTANDVIIYYPVDTEKWSLRFHFNYYLNKNITLKSRVEFSEYAKDGIIENGFIAYQDINYSFNKIPLKLNFRYAIFDAPYDARIYAYESDILYAFSVPAYYYKGFRVYLTAKYDITNNLTIWLRYSQFNYSDRNVISESGLNQIDANTKSEVKLQLAYKF